MVHSAHHGGYPQHYRPSEGTVRELQDAYKGNVILHLAAENMLDSLFDERLEKMASFLLKTATTSWLKPVTSIRRWDCGTYSCV